MFLFWLLLALAIGTLENITDRYKAHKLHNDPNFRRQWGDYLDRK